MKATSIFGGVQVFQIIIQIIRSKFVALLLGPLGMGIAGLLASTLGFIGSITNFGLATSAVKEIAAADGQNNQTRVSSLVIVLRRLVWITGTLGAVLTIVFASRLSQFAFGNHNYTFAFIWISITLLFSQLSKGQMAILQGMRKLQYLAKANLVGSILGLITTIPLYYFYGINGIVPGIIVASVTTLILSWYYSRKIQIQPVKVSRLRSIAEGKNMLSLGFMISLSGIMEAAIGYIVLIYINKVGGAAQVGLYNAGFAIINTYVGLVFTAMATDYYPRLSSAAGNNQQCKETINQQAEIAILILAPILIIFMVFINWLIILLYSTKFIEINEMIHWAALGMFFKAASWSISFIFLAKGTTKLFFWNELVSKSYLLGFNLLGYFLFGLKGLGISFLVVFLVYLIQVYIVGKVKFDFGFKSDFIRIFTLQFSLALASFLAVKNLTHSYAYVIGSIFVILSSWLSYRELDKRLGLKSVLVEIKHKFR